MLRLEDLGGEVREVNDQEIMDAKAQVARADWAASRPAPQVSPGRGCCGVKELSVRTSEWSAS